MSDFRYDSNGNQVGGGGRRATYDAHDKPVSVTEAGSTVRHFYGPNFERYKRITSAGTTYYLDKLHERTVGAGTVTERDYVGDKIVITRVTGRLGIVVGERAEYLHPDRLGSTDTLTDSAGLLVRRQGFDPFGGPRNDQWRATPILGNTVTDRGFTGQEQVDDVHLVHMGGRAYDYRLGRFLSVDPFVVEPRDMQSLNAYSYARNNPTGRIDPTGYADEEAKITRLQVKRVWVSDPGIQKRRPLRDPGERRASPTGPASPSPRAQAKVVLAGYSTLGVSPEDSNKPGTASYRVISSYLRRGRAEPRPVGPEEGRGRPLLPLPSPGVLSKRRSTLDSVGGSESELASWQSRLAALTGALALEMAPAAAATAGEAAASEAIVAAVRNPRIVMNAISLGFGAYKGWNAGSKSVKLGLDGMDLAIDVGESATGNFFGTAAIAGGFSAVGGAEPTWSSVSGAVRWGFFGAVVNISLLRGGAVLPEHEDGIPLDLPLDGLPLRARRGPALLFAPGDPARDGALRQRDPRGRREPGP